MPSNNVTPNDYYETPADVFAEAVRTLSALTVMKSFTLDAAAVPETAKGARFFTQDDDGLKQSWGDDTVWCNPPYSRGNLKAWTAKARKEALGPHGALSCLLIPHDTSTRWWWNNVVGKGQACSLFSDVPGAYSYFDTDTCLTVVVVPLRKRVKFLLNGKVAKGGAKFPSAFVFYIPAAY